MVGGDTEDILCNYAKQIKQWSYHLLFHVLPLKGPIGYMCTIVLEDQRRVRESYNCEHLNL